MRKAFEGMDAKEIRDQAGEIADKMGAVYCAGFEDAIQRVLDTFEGTLEMSEGEFNVPLSSIVLFLKDIQPKVRHGMFHDKEGLKGRQEAIDKMLAQFIKPEEVEGANQSSEKDARQ